MRNKAQELSRSSFICRRGHSLSERLIELYFCALALEGTRCSCVFYSLLYMYTGLEIAIHFRLLQYNMKEKLQVMDWSSHGNSDMSIVNEPEGEIWEGKWCSCFDKTV